MFKTRSNRDCQTAFELHVAHRPKTAPARGILAHRRARAREAGKKAAAKRQPLQPRANLPGNVISSAEGTHGCDLSAEGGRQRYTELVEASTVVGSALGCVLAAEFDDATKELNAEQGHSAGEASTESRTEGWTSKDTLIQGVCGRAASGALLADEGRQAAGTYRPSVEERRELQRFLDVPFPDGGFRDREMAIVKEQLDRVHDMFTQHTIAGSSNVAAGPERP
ncbi:hypothetical protein C8R43DRAFT_942792 [Mycena crocata]|nr:hypothetical protein C8R43DRAFT_942792 [Mycena crocata]